MAKKDKTFDKIIKVMDDYYILPKRVLEMQKLPFYKQELLLKIYKVLEEK